MGLWAKIVKSLKEGINKILRGYVRKKTRRIYKACYQKVICGDIFNSKNNYHLNTYRK